MLEGWTDWAQNFGSHRSNRFCMFFTSANNSAKAPSMTEVPFQFR